jgi:hypothetical protein
VKWLQTEAEAHIRTLRDGMDAGLGAARLGQDLPRGADECLAGLGTAAFESVPARRASARPSIRATILMDSSFFA